MTTLSRHFLDEYAEDGELDLSGSLAQVFEEAVQDTTDFSRNKTGEEGAYFKERAELLIAIQSELRKEES